LRRQLSQRIVGELVLRRPPLLEGEAPIPGSEAFVLDGWSGGVAVLAIVGEVRTHERVADPEERPAEQHEHRREQRGEAQPDRPSGAAPEPHGIR
jgi:hypothetical protein